MGQIITFYSYKGGTGRTMALANMAWLLASNGNRVLVADWDLEAPGLHRYLAPFLTDRSLEDSRGIIDVMVEFAKQAVTPGERPDKWYAKLAKIDKLATAVNWNFPPSRDSNGRETRGYLEFISAGQQTSTYATRVNSFNWDNFYERLGGGQFINEIRTNLRDAYDYVLIDSRTGVSDTSGICTVQLPDKVVVCFTLNNQSIEGASIAAKAIVSQRGGAAGRFPVFPVPTRVDYSEDERLNLRRDHARYRFRDFLTFLPEGVSPELYWNEVEVPYRALYAYEELLTPFGDKLNDPKSVLAAFERMAHYVTGADQRLREMDSREQERVRREFAGIPSFTGLGVKPAPVAAEQIAAPAASIQSDIYFSFHPADAVSVQSIRDRLRASGHDGVSGPALESGRWGEEVPKRLSESRRFVYFVGPRGLTAWQRRELAFATEEWKRARAVGGDFEIVPVLLPQAGGADLPTDFLMVNGVDFRAGIESRPAWDTMVRLLRIEISGYARSAMKGDQPYEEEDAAVLPGRDDDIRKLAGMITKRLPRLVRLRGDSGCGKTSLIEAGLIPYLRRQADQRWEIVSVRPGADPFVAFAEAIQPLLRTGAGTDRVSHTLQLGTSLGTGTLTIHSVLLLALRENPGARILFVLDETEELFTLTQEPQRIQFAKGLDALPPELPVTVLIAFRPDWEAAAEALTPRLRETPCMTLGSLGQSWIDRIWARRKLAEGDDLTRQAVIDEILERALDNARDRRLIALSRLSSGEVPVASLPENTVRTLDPFVANGLVTAVAAPDTADNLLRLEGEGAALREFMVANAAPLAWRTEVLKAIASGLPAPPAASKEWVRFLDATERSKIEGEFRGEFTEMFGTPSPASATQKGAALPQYSQSPAAPSPVWPIEARVRSTSWLPYAAALLTAALVLAGTFAGAWWLGRGASSEPSVSPDQSVLKDAGSAFDAKDYRKAVDLYNRWIKSNPSNPSASAYSNRGQAHQALGQLEDAEIDFTNALGLDPSNAAYFVSRAAVRADQRKLAEAREDIVEAIKLDPAIKSSPKITSREALASAAVEAQAGVRPVVMGHVAFDAQKAELTYALETLRTRGYDPEKQIETVGEKAPVRSELRYFQAESADEATKLADLLKSKGILVEPVLVKGRPANHFEVWLAARPERPANAREMYYEAK